MAARRKQSTRPATLGERIREKRAERHWTQEFLAEKAGTSQAVIQKIENGKSLRPRGIEKIAKALDSTPSWLMFGKETADGLDAPAVEVARAWSKLREPYRTAMRKALESMSRGG